MDLFETPYIDISPTIQENLAVFPGDTAFSRQVLMSFEKGDHLTLSSISGTVHLGAHADAPIHYHAQGQTMEERPLSYYLGDCQVIHAKASKGERLSSLPQEIIAPRVLVRTDSFPNPNKWNSDFNSFDPQLIKDLAKKGVKLIGIDTPSVDPQDSKGLESHQAIYENDMAVLEGVVLEHVDEGLYTLVALPLKIQGADASPVRAILLPKGKPHEN